MQHFLSFNPKSVMDLKNVVAILLGPLKDFPPLLDLLPDLLRMLIDLIKQSLFQENRVVLYPDIAVLFVAIKQFIEKSSLAQWDIQDVYKIPSVRAHLETHACTTCMEQIRESKCSLHNMCYLCGNIVCNECFLSWESVCLKKAKRQVTCPTCRTPVFGQRLQDRSNSNSLCWAAIVFAVIFGEDFKASFLSEQKKLDRDSFPDLSVLGDMLRFLRRKLWDLRFSHSEFRQIQCLTFRGSVADCSVADGSIADSSVADGSVADGSFADGSAGDNIYD
jgi:hypothetical protein